MFWEILARDRPFNDLKTNGALVRAVLGGARPPIPSDAPSSAFNTMVQLCWSPEPSSRPLITEVVRILRALS